MTTPHIRVLFVDDHAIVRRGRVTSTGRGRDVLACVARGLSNRALATELGMAGLTARTLAALFAVGHGLERGP